MPFILSAQRDDDVTAAFGRYRAYLLAVRHSMPEAAFALASSDWYFSPHDHRCPHDAWLESITISEPCSGKRHEVRSTSILIRLLGAYHDGFIEFHYSGVLRYEMNAFDCAQGLRDWRYDEFRVSESGHVIHEIEWWGADASARWVIEASEVNFQWHPKESA